jgi:hypothetical protein
VYSADHPRTSSIMPQYCSGETRHPRIWSGDLHVNIHLCFAIGMWNYVGPKITVWEGQGIWVSLAGLGWGSKSLPVDGEAGGRQGEAISASSSKAGFWEKGSKRATSKSLRVFQVMNVECRCSCILERLCKS